MRRYDLPHHSEWLEQDIGYIEDGKEPFVLTWAEIKFLLHACDSGIAIRAISRYSVVCMVLAVSTQCWNDRGMLGDL